MWRELFLLTLVSTFWNLINLKKHLKNECTLALDKKSFRINLLLVKNLDLKFKTRFCKIEWKLETYFFCCEQSLKPVFHPSIYNKFRRSGVLPWDSSTRRIPKLWYLSRIVGEANMWWLTVEVFNLKANIIAIKLSLHLHPIRRVFVKKFSLNFTVQFFAKILRLKINTFQCLWSPEPGLFLFGMK